MTQPNERAGRIEQADRSRWPWRTWRTAMAAALYGPDGFYRRQTPGAHFRTSAHVGTVLAEALLELARRHAAHRIVDVGAGYGELLTALNELGCGLRLTGIDVAPRPLALPAAVEWSGWEELRPSPGTLLVANEWLDNVPLDVAEVDRDGVVRLVEVDRDTGEERPGPPLPEADARWLARWWPLRHAQPGGRAEIGSSRDEAWVDAVRRIRPDIAVAIDYGHLLGARPVTGTLTGYRDGGVAPPVPDGGCDITAHVAVDAVRTAGERAGMVTAWTGQQSEALRTLGVSATRPDIGSARTDPAGYLRGLARASQAAELLDPDGLGGFDWLIQTRPSPSS